MNKIFSPKSFALILSALLIGCQPSQEAIEQAIVETQAIEHEYQQQTDDVIQQFTQEPTQTVKSTLVPESTILYMEDFEEGVANDWENHRGEWPVVTDSDGNHYWKGTGQSAWTYGFYGMGNEWSDYIFESRVRLVSGNVYICLRTDNDWTFYAVGLHTEGRRYVNISINDTRGEYEWIDLEDNDLLLNANEWYLIRVTITNEKISLEINDKLILEAELPIPNASEYGGIGYYIQEGMEVHFDDIRVWSIASPAQALSIAQTEEPTPTSVVVNDAIEEEGDYISEMILKATMCTTALDTMGSKFLLMGENPSLMSNSIYLKDTCLTEMCQNLSILPQYYRFLEPIILKFTCQRFYRNSPDFTVDYGL